ncbi:TPA: DUF6678 family protein [Vibrio parahaemolyticus]|uniref:DUF6678 family protein n=1 Tax=Vibrio parahaemolyticus TaxID=670 RepID=UPI0005B6F1D2|nr:DUF6678 family protein [Vibrio parahaemolyticus]EGQ7779456.1 hypothetical protein [Vibrio parahaemolyticus]EHE6967929.1 hypothetical protein [Vibrio parahaemolyticus]
MWQGLGLGGRVVHHLMRRYVYWEFMRLDLKSNIIKLIDNNGLFGVMNNTKWNNLLAALSDIDELLSYRVTYIDGSTWPESDTSYQYTSELAQIWGNFRAIHFIDIDARISHSRGVLLEPEVLDHRDKVIAICKEQNAKISLTECGVRIWGYFQHGKDIEMYKYT